MGRYGWTVLATFVVLLLAWWGLRMLWWRMNYMVPAFGLGVLVGVALAGWLFTRRRA